MSNPSVCFLTSTSIEGIHFGIEDNLGEAIHIHLGKLRLALTIEEFFLLAEGVMEAAQELFRVRKLELESFDIESLKVDWLKNYGKITSIQMGYATLDSLYMKESYVENRAIKRIIPLRESGYIKVLQGDKSDINYYEDPGRLEPSRKQKLDFIRQKIESVGYPWEQKRILIDQEGYIYDGIKRASCLYYLYGGKKEIPVQRICIPKKKTIEMRREEAEKEVQAWNEKCIFEKNHSNSEQVCIYPKSEEAENTDLKEFVKKIKETEIPFFLLRKNKRDPDGNLIAIAIVVVQEGSLGGLQKKLKGQLLRSCPYDNYEFLYTAPKPLYYQTKEGPVFVFDRLCCKNKYEKYILPVDRYVLEKSWECIVWNEEWQCYEAGEDIYVLMVLMDAIFERGSFEQEDIEAIQRYEKVLHRAEFQKMLEKQFYQYTPVLKKYLLSRQYHYAICMHECFSGY